MRMLDRRTVRWTNEPGAFAVTHKRTEMPLVGGERIKCHKRRHLRWRSDAGNATSHRRGNTYNTNNNVNLNIHRCRK